MLSALLLCNTTVVYADDLHGGSSGSIDVTPTITIPPPAIDPHALDELIFRLVRPDIAGVADNLQTWWDKWFGDRWKTDADRQKDYSISSDGSTVHLHKQFVDDLNQAVQDKIHALDGYWLLESEPNTFLEFASGPSYWNSNPNKDKNIETYTKFASSYSFIYNDRNGKSYSWHFYGFNPNPDLFYFADNADGNYVKSFNSSNNSITEVKVSHLDGTTPWSSGLSITADSSSFYVGGSFFDKNYPPRFFGSPLKIFYSLQDVKNYLNKGRTYAPQLPSTTISIPIKYINNSVSLPDITYNIDTTNKTEVEIQNEYNTTLNNYLNDLNNFTDGSEVTPTPTPDGGFTDGVTPTPKPDFGDGSDPTDTNDWLKKIYEWLQSFGDTHSKFEKAITDYIEANDGKLDQIIEAINALSDGKTEDEKNGCKYDFTALSDFMTKLWNESDKKFDKMVELLEENNKYQKKLVNSLNEIKAILVTQTIMDVFQDRSQQTAEKAKDKFPTSLPWDIALVVNAMSAEPEKPQFDLPIQIKSLNINEEIHVDLASGEWEKLAKTCRYLLSILFILLMIQLSRKLFSNGGDD